jgi:hypothetical protein
MAATSGGTSKFVIACLIITNVALLSVVVIPRLKLGAMVCVWLLAVLLVTCVDLH